jgi:AraC-like DNA-binding protein
MTSALFDHANRVAGSYLQPLLEAAARRGVTAQALEQAAGLPPATLEPLPESLPADDYVRLLDIAASLADDPHFGLHVGQCVKLGTYTVYGLILLSCRDFGHVFEQTMRYEQLTHDLGRSSITTEDGIAYYTWHSNYSSAHRHLADSVFAGIRVFSNWLAGITLPANDLKLTHDGGPPELRDEYVRVLGDLPEFNAGANVASFNATMLSWPVPNADVSLHPVLQQHAEQLLQQRAASQPAQATQAAIMLQVQAAIVANLSSGQVRLAAIADELKLSPRTLQRKLKEAGTTFQQVLDQARFALAKEYLKRQELGLVDIAFLLGYQEQSAFNHAFKEWAGINPGAWRSA